MDEFEFDRLIELYQKGLLTGKKKELVEKWFNSLNEDSGVNFSNEDQLKLKGRIFNEIKKSPETIGLKQIDNTSVNSRWIILKVAASILLIALCTYLVWPYVTSSSSDAGTLTANSSGDVTKVFLCDGTLVWLKGKSSLTYPTDLSGKTRRVSLQGEALFEVAKDAGRPFIIQCGALTTTVLGTSFNIKSNQDKIEVVVLTGKVSLTTANDTQGVIVLPNETVVYDGLQRSIARIPTMPEEKLSTVKGTEYLMAFEDTRMNEVIGRIEGKFDVKVAMSDSRLGNCKITADFSDQSLERTLSMISQAVGFEYQISGKSVNLTGNGCD
jgi:transmembrane sensor